MDNKASSFSLPVGEGGRACRLHQLNGQKGNWPACMYLQNRLQHRVQEAVGSCVSKRP